MSGGRSAKEISLSVEDSNALRAKLGLSSLRQDEKKEGARPGQSSMETDVLLAPVVPGEKAKEEELREKLTERKEKRTFTQRLKAVKTLGEASDDEDDSAAAWVKRSRSTAQKQAKRQAKMLEDMDEQLSAAPSKKETYGSQHLRGMTVKHDMEQFEEGHQTILTLQDTGVLDDDAEDVLMNVNLAEDERTKQRLEESRKKAGYDPKQGMDDDEAAMLGLGKKSVLDKYDDVDALTGDKELKSNKSFRIGFENEKSEEEKRKEEVRQRLLQAESLEMKAKNVSDFYSEEEMAKFKKKKKRRKTKARKKRRVRADDLLGLEEEDESTGLAGAAATDADGGGAAMDTTAEEAQHEVKDEDDILNQANDAELEAAEREMEAELQASLTRARRARSHARKKRTDVTQLLDAAVKKAEEAKESNNTANNKGVVFSTMSEFVRNIGAGSTEEEQPRKRSKRPDAGSEEAPKEEPSSAMETEQDEEGAEAKQAAKAEAEEAEDEEAARTFQSSFSTAHVTTDKEHKDRKAGLDDTPVLGDEGNVGSSVAAAINLAVRKGYLTDEEKRKKAAAAAAQASSKLADLTSKHSQQEEREPDEHDARDYRRDSRRNRPMRNPMEKANYKPSFRLSYTDETGRELTPKEAFTYMSHRFHGKSSGRMKTEKKLRKRQQEEALLKMSSEDTPLGSVVGLRKHQEQTGKAHVVLSGSQKQ